MPVTETLTAGFQDRSLQVFSYGDESAGRMSEVGVSSPRRSTVSCTARAEQDRMVRSDLHAASANNICKKWMAVCARLMKAMTEMTEMRLALL